MLNWNLEDWISDVGADLVEKRFSDAVSITVIESAVYEIWLLDTEARNGGLSQYFCNHGKRQWAICQDAALPVGLNSFHDFADALNALIGKNQDPYEAIRSQGDSAEDLWYLYQSAVVQELKGLYQNTITPEFPPMYDQTHPIIDRPWTYEVLQLHIDLAAKELIMVLRKEAEVIKLRFIEFQQLSIDEGYTGTESGMEILDLSSSGMEHARVRVRNFEQDPAITFWARDVERIQE